MRLYDEIVPPRTSMIVHADAMARRGKWIPVLLETQARKRSKAEYLATTDARNGHRTLRHLRGPRPWPLQPPARGIHG
jgi:hypothetical protein